MDKNTETFFGQRMFDSGEKMLEKKGCGCKNHSPFTYASVCSYFTSFASSNSLMIDSSGALVSSDTTMMNTSDTRNAGSSS